MPKADGRGNTRIFKNAAAEKFWDVFGDFPKQRTRHLEEFEGPAARLCDAVSAFSLRIATLNNSTLDSDYAYFLGHVGGGYDDSLTNYKAIPLDYAKIEQGLLGHPELESEWATIRTMADEVLELYHAFPNVRYEVLNSIKSIRSLFLKDVPERAEHYYADDFFSETEDFVRAPIRVDTKAQLGERSVEILTKCAEEILRVNPRSDKAAELVEAIMAFAQEIEKKGWHQDFAAINKAKTALKDVPS